MNNEELRVDAELGRLRSTPTSQRAWDDAARAVMEALWQPRFGYTSPNRVVYPWQWLWDSCFHAIVWSHLGDERAVTELETLLGLQRADGMVPHIGYQADPSVATRIWGGDGVSTITQPPMYGHALRVLASRGHRIEHLLEPAAAGLRFFASRRRALVGGGVVIVHPWESGADDSPRWDGWGEEQFDRPAWLRRKLGLLETVMVNGAGSAVANPQFSVVAAGFNALVAFNCRELASLTGDSALLAFADEVVTSLDGCWDPAVASWDDRDSDGRISSAVRTLDAMLAILVSGNGAAMAQAVEVLSSASFLEPYGLTGVARDEPSFRATEYWRGPAWPPLMYLLVLALRRSGFTDLGDDLTRRSLTGGALSGLAEYYDPATGEGLGAAPQGWACLGAVLLEALSSQG